MESTIRLFKAVPITEKGKSKASKSLMSETIKRGFIFSPEVVHNYSEKDLILMIDVVEKEVGLRADAMNNAFHKSWKKIAESSMEQLVIEQIMHYITTYGFESLGIYDKDSVYIPCEKLEIPKLKIDKIKLVVIRGYTKSELKEKLIGLLGSGIALSNDTKKDVIDIVTFVDFVEDEIRNIKNKEVKCALYDYLNIFPQDSVEFLRFMIYKSTNTTLIIKNASLIKEIKSKDNLSVLGLIEKYQKKYGLEKLAQVFFRFKPLFLAFRTNKKLKIIINRIRKLADKHHLPMKEDYLNSVTANIKKGEDTSWVVFRKELDKVNTFRKIRLAYALKFRTNKDADSILYRIRNGKSYATTFKFDNNEKAEAALKVTIEGIIKDVSKNVDGKTIYIPENIHYALPATEKQFTGNFPSGTYVSIPKNIVVGVHWENVKENRIDLDLSMSNCTDGKIGWDAMYRTERNDVLFSGDLTDAPKPNGAAEIFYVKKQNESSFILMLNYFNYSDCEYNGGTKLEVPFKIFVGSEEIKNFGRNYMINPNNVVCVAKSKIAGRQKTIGLLTTSPDENRFYFAETNMGNSITSYGADYTEHARKYMFDFYKNTISLNDILIKSGAKIIKNKDKADIDLSYEKIEKDTILNILTKKSRE